MQKKYYLIALPIKKYHDGNDFIIDTIPFMKENGFTVINTRKYGKLFSFFYEFLLFFTLKRNAMILTTWPGFPKITVSDRLYINYLRIYLFLLFKRVKKWDYAILPIDMHLLLAKSRISEKLYHTHQFIEDKVFRSANSIIACGDVLYKKFKGSYPHVTCIKMDLYDQVLPSYQPSAKSLNKQKIEIVILGNMLRMIDMIEELPESENISYKVIGKNGDAIKDLNRTDISYLGVLEDKDLLPTLGNFDFGLIVYSKKNETYFSYNIAGKVTSYLLAGVPLICLQRYTSMAHLTREHHLGICITELDDLSGAIAKTTMEDYSEMRKNSAAMSRKIASFEHYKNTLKEAYPNQKT